MHPVAPSRSVRRGLVFSFFLARESEPRRRLFAAYLSRPAVSSPPPRDREEEEKEAHLEVLDRVLEVVVVVVPARRLDIEHLVVEAAQPRDLALEAPLDAEKRLGDLLAARAAELRQRPRLAARRRALARELDLPLADLHGNATVTGSR